VSIYSAMSALHTAAVDKQHWRNGNWAKYTSLYRVSATQGSLRSARLVICDLMGYRTRVSSWHLST